MKVSNIALYGGLDSTVADTVAAKEYLDTLGVEYANLFYSDPAQFPMVLAPVNTWFDNVEVTAFPFVVWDETNTAGETTRKIATTVKAIKAANLKPAKGSKE